MASQRSLYDVLNVAPDAEPVVIEAAYRALMKKYHPDQAAADGEGRPSSAADINRAFEILRDSTRRADYDHREWTRRQSVRLAELQKIPPPPRPRRAFGWGGWFVALLLAIALFVIVQGRAGLVAPPTGENLAEAVAAAEPEPRSRPVRIEPSFIRASGPNEVEREILAREAAETENVAAAREAAEKEAEAIAEADERTAAELSQIAPRPITRERASQPRLKPKAPPRAVRRPGESEEDFLQREGYIY
ncbi:MAG TPA: J domain-containing protein [Allosphingosinicella sp.]